MRIKSNNPTQLSTFSSRRARKTNVESIIFIETGAETCNLQFDLLIFAIYISQCHHFYRQFLLLMVIGTLIKYN